MFYKGHNLPPMPKVSLNELREREYAKNKCMFCKGVQEFLNRENPKLFPQPQKHSSKDNSGSVNHEQILKIYQDISTDDIKTNFSSKYEVIRNNLELKYLTSKEYYNTKIINDIIYNENTHIVSVFKDYLIFDDVSEFLKRQYEVSESKKRLPKVIEFYETYSKVFPNYVNLPENKYMFKNIERKQLYWDSKQQFLMEQEEKNHKKKARIEDFGGVQNAPSSFFDESMDDKMFTNSFIKGVNSMEPLPDNTQSFLKKVTLKDGYDSHVLDKDNRKNVAKQLQQLVTQFATKEDTTVHSQSVLDLSELSKHLEDESIYNKKFNDPDVSDFFKKSAKEMREKEAQKRRQKLNSKLHQYNENKVEYERSSPQDSNSHKKPRKVNNENNAIELISNHYNGKNKKDRYHAGLYEKSTKPSSDNKIIVNSGTI